jgi:predicted aconitase with swiveling domain
MKKVILLAALAVMSAISANAQVIVNPDGTHSTVHGKVIVNPDGTHSTVHGKVIVNPDGTHSTVHGKVIVNSNGTHFTNNGKLPIAAMEFIDHLFSDAAISLATMNWALLGTTYDVVFIDGRSVEFDRKGEWKHVDCGHTAVPEEIVPEAILRHIAANHSGSRIREINRGRRKWKIKLENDLELKFDSRCPLQVNK